MLNENWTSIDKRLKVFCFNLWVDIYVFIVFFNKIDLQSLLLFWTWYNTVIPTSRSDFLSNSAKGNPESVEPLGGLVQEIGSHLNLHLAWICLQVRTTAQTRPE